MLYHLVPLSPYLWSNHTSFGSIPFPYQAHPCHRAFEIAVPSARNMLSLEFPLAGFSPFKSRFKWNLIWQLLLTSLPLYHFIAVGALLSFPEILLLAVWVNWFETVSHLGANMALFSLFPCFALSRCSILFVWNWFIEWMGLSHCDCRRLIWEHHSDHSASNLLTYSDALLQAGSTQHNQNHVASGSPAGESVGLAGQQLRILVRCGSAHPPPPRA